MQVCKQQDELVPTGAGLAASLLGSPLPTSSWAGPWLWEGCQAAHRSVTLPLPSQLLYTLTFWLLLRQFVKEKLLRRKKTPSALMEVTVADTGEWAGQWGQPPPA